MTAPALTTDEWTNPTPELVAQRVTQIRNDLGWTRKQFAHGIGWPLRLLEAVEAGEPTNMLCLGEWLEMLESLAWAQEVFHRAEGMNSGLALKLESRLKEAEKLLADVRRQIPAS